MLKSRLIQNFATVKSIDEVVVAWFGRNSVGDIPRVKFKIVNYLSG